MVGAESLLGPLGIFGLEAPYVGSAQTGAPRLAPFLWALTREQEDPRRAAWARTTGRRAERAPPEHLGGDNAIACSLATISKLPINQLED